MNKYEYNCFAAPTKVGELVTVLNELGQDGWEVVDTVPIPSSEGNLLVIAKRQLPKD